MREKGRAAQKVVSCKIISSDQSSHNDDVLLQVPKTPTFSKFNSTIDSFYDCYNEILETPVGHLGDMTLVTLMTLMTLGPLWDNPGTTLVQL